MSNVNRVFLLGNLTRDPELRQTASGMSVTDLGLAVSEKYRNKAGEDVETVCFADIVVWGRQAETCSQYLEKGAPVMIEGRLQLDRWETDAGEKRSRLRVKADRVQFLGRRQHDSRSETEGATTPEHTQEPDKAAIPF
jgi:single-strand DNA-binding protein